LLTEARNTLSISRFKEYIGPSERLDKEVSNDAICGYSNGLTGSMTPSSGQNDYLAGPLMELGSDYSQRERRLEY
jgi:hypothetical protein